MMLRYIATMSNVGGSDARVSTIDLGSDESIDLAVRLTRGARRLVRDLVRVREQHQYTLSAVADAIGIHRSGVSRFERQESSPQLDTLLRYAHAVGAELTFTVTPRDGWAEIEPRSIRHVGSWTAAQDSDGDGDSDRSVSPDTQWWDFTDRRITL